MSSLPSRQTLSLETGGCSTDAGADEGQPGDLWLAALYNPRMGYRSYREPRNRPAAHIVTAADRRQRLVAGLALRAGCVLVVRPLRMAADLHAARLGVRVDQFALELGRAAEHGVYRSETL